MTRVRVYRGRRATTDADRAATRRLVEQVGETGVPAVRVWRPGRQLAFGRRDTRSDGYERAREAATDHGFQPVERSVGGRAVAYADSTLAFAYAVPTEETGAKSGLDERYAWAVETVLRALSDCGAAVTRGEPPNAYCPGAYSVRASRESDTDSDAPDHASDTDSDAPDHAPGGDGDASDHAAGGDSGGKIAGIAQRVHNDAALVAGSVTVAEASAIRAVLRDVYDALGVPFDPDSVGSVAGAGGPAEPTPVRRALENTLVGDHDRLLRDVTEL
ncbi:MAG: lipoate--protein ligase family protein [Halobaculum sp.]